MVGFPNELYRVVERRAGFYGALWAKYLEDVFKDEEVVSFYLYTKLISKEERISYISLLSIKNLYYIAVTNNGINLNFWPIEKIASIRAGFDLMVKESTEEDEDIQEFLYRFIINLKFDSGEGLTHEVQGNLNTLKDLQEHAKKIKEALS